jgi:hypothetical protein
MRTASILLSLVVVLGFLRESRAALYTHDYTISVAGNRIGFVEIGNSFGGQTFFRIGPEFSFEVPFTAKQGIVGFCVIIIGIVALLTLFTVRWRKREHPR